MAPRRESAFVCLYITPSHYHHCAKLSKDIELQNACQIYFVECVSKIKNILSVIHYTICGAVCFQFTHFPSDDRENIYTLLIIIIKLELWTTVYPKKYAHGFCFAVLCCGYTLTDFPISIRLTSLALWQSNDCPSASKATLMNMDKYFMWIHYERLHNHNKAKHNKTVCIFLGIYCITHCLG